MTNLKSFYEKDKAYQGALKQIEIWRTGRFMMDRDKDRSGSSNCTSDKEGTKSSGREAKRKFLWVSLARGGNTDHNLSKSNHVMEIAGCHNKLELD